MAVSNIVSGVPGNAKIIKMPIKTVDIKLDDIGYAGWVATLRTNPRAEYYDMFISSDEETSWVGFGNILVDWNFGDEDGNKLPLPPRVKSGEGLSQAALPYDVQRFLIVGYVDAFNEAAGLPKQQRSNSDDSSSTSEKSPESDSK